MEPLSTQRNATQTESELTVPGSVARDASTRIRLDLQRRAPANFRRHGLRGVRRFVVLLVADLAVVGELLARVAQEH